MTILLRTCSDVLRPRRLLRGRIQLLGAERILSGGREWHQVRVPVSRADGPVCGRQWEHEGAAAATRLQVPLRLGRQRPQRSQNIRRLQGHAVLPRIPRRFQRLNETSLIEIPHENNPWCSRGLPRLPRENWFLAIHLLLLSTVVGYDLKCVCVCVCVRACVRACVCVCVYVSFQ